MLARAVSVREVPLHKLDLDLLQRQEVLGRSKRMFEQRLTSALYGKGGHRFNKEDIEIHAGT